MKLFRINQGFIPVLLLIAFFLVGMMKVQAQEGELLHRPLQRIGNTFESVMLIDNQTTLVPLKKTAEFDIQHRFGVVKNGYDDFFGLYAPSNIRIGMSYVPIDHLMVGFGFTKDRLLWDFNAKYAFFDDGPNGGDPFSLAYYVNMSVDTRDKSFFRNSTDRYSYFHQLMIAKKLTDNLSVQGALSISHFNRVDAFINQDLEIEGKMKNDHIAFSFLGSYKVSDAMAFVVNVDQPITEHLTNNPNPNVSFGIELATPMHAFQVFVGNYRWIVPQYNNVFNNNNYEDGEFLIGFNITRLFDFEMENIFHMMFKPKKK